MLRTMPTFTAVVIVACSSLLFAGCGGSSSGAKATVTVTAGSTASAGGRAAGNSWQGTYYSQTTETSAGKLLVKGSTVTYWDVDCSGGTPDVESTPSGRGELSDDGAQIVWNSDDEHVNNDIMSTTTPVTVTKAGDLAILTIINEEDHEVFRSGRACQGIDTGGATG